MRWTSPLSIARMVLVGACPALIGLKAQTIRPSPSAAEVAGLLRKQGVAGQALQVLTQTAGPQSTVVMNAIADTLVAIATTLPGDDVRGAQTRMKATETLMLAGIGRGGVPFEGAARRLFQIAEKRNSAGALWALTQLPNKSDALAFLRQAAVSPEPIALSAVDYLASKMEDAGISSLRELLRTRAIQQDEARRMAERIASARGWP